MDALAKILIVDDSDINRAVYRQILSALPAEIIEAANGSEALAEAQRHDLALVLLDVHMPGMSGYETAASLRLDRRTETTPVIFISASCLDDTCVKRGYRAGAVDFVPNTPVDPDILRQKAAVFLELHRLRAAMQDTIDRLERERDQLSARYHLFQEGQKSVYRRATHDPLTSLPNRALFEDRLAVVLHHAERAGQRFVLGFMDVDGLKQVNDQHGHFAGDELLTGVAQRLRQALRQSDTVARLGGDEFALLLEGLDGAAAADFLRAKVQRILCEPLTLRTALSGTPVEIRPRASIGVAIYPDHARSAADLLKIADACMYAAKRSGGGVRLHGDAGCLKEEPAGLAGLAPTTAPQ